jgi:pilus assembly protein Flp/PilA
MAKFLKLIKNSKGATAIEYGLIAALIAVAAIAAMQNIGTKLGTTFNNVSNELYATRLGRTGSGGAERRRRFLFVKTCLLPHSHGKKTSNCGML